VSGWCRNSGSGPVGEAFRDPLFDQGVGERQVLLELAHPLGGGRIDRLRLQLPRRGVALPAALLG
jgi:hypothetical protein